jgi:hypothetical protein
MTRQLVIHKIDKRRTDAETQKELISLMEAIFNDKNHNLRVRQLETHVLFYLRILRKEHGHSHRKLLRKEES